MTLQLKMASAEPAGHTGVPSILKKPEHALDAPDAPLAPEAASSAGNGAEAAPDTNLPDITNDKPAPATPDRPVTTSPFKEEEGLKAGSSVEDSAMKKGTALTAEE